MSDVAEKSSVARDGAFDPGSLRSGGASAPRHWRAPATWWSLLGLVGLVLAAYGQTAHFDLVLDEPVIVTGDLMGRARAGWWEILSSPQSAYLGDISGANQMYRPVLALSLAVERTVWGMRPGGLHLTSVLAHLAVVILLWHLAWRMTGSAGAAFAAGALLAVHPSAVEGVALALGARMDLFAGLGMAAVVLLLRDCLRPGGSWRLAGALLCFAFALGSKETALAIPPLVTWAAVAYPEWFGVSPARPGWRRLAARVAPFWVVLGLYLALRHTVMGGLPSLPLHPAELPGRALLALVAVATYARMTLLPRPVSPSALLSRVAPPAGLADGRVLLGLVAVGLLVAGLLWLQRRHPPSALALGWYAAALVPTSNLMPIYWEHAVYVAERSLYPALVGWCLFVATGLHALWSRAGSRPLRSAWLARSIGAAVVGTFLVVTAAKAGAWRDDRTLWRAAFISEPDSVVTRYNLARSLARAGDLEAAQAAVGEAATLFPADPHVAMLAAWIAELRGDGGEALRLYERGLGLGAQEAPALRQAALLAVRVKEWGRAAHLFAVVATRAPKAAWPQVGLGWYHEGQGRPDLARAHFEHAARLEPNSPERPFFLGQLHAASGRMGNAIHAYREALAINPSHVLARGHLALLLEADGQTTEAVHHWRRVIESLPEGSLRDMARERLQHLVIGAAGSSIVPAR